MLVEIFYSPRQHKMGKGGESVQRDAYAELLRDFVHALANALTVFVFLFFHVSTTVLRMLTFSQQFAGQFYFHLFYHHF